MELFQIPSDQIANQTINFSGFMVLSLGMSAAMGMFMYLTTIAGRRKVLIYVVELT